MFRLSWRAKGSAIVDCWCQMFNQQNGMSCPRIITTTVVLSINQPIMLQTSCLWHCPCDSWEPFRRRSRRSCRRLRRNVRRWSRRNDSWFSRKWTKQTTRILCHSHTSPMWPSWRKSWSDCRALPAVAATEPSWRLVMSMMTVVMKFPIHN